MNFKISTILKSHWPKILSVFIFIILLGAYANIFAIDNPFSPGQTLNPNCGPLEANCYIDLNTGGGSNPWLTSSNGIYYDGGGVGIGGSDISINTAVSGGVIWDNIYEEEISSFAVSSEVDSNGNNVSAFYSFGEGANLTLLICRDESCDDSDSYNIASGISVGEGFTPSPSLKIGSDGSIHIAYLSLEPTEGPIETNFFYATCNISGCESPEITPISFSGGIDPEMVAGYSLALDENDDPYIIFGSVIISEGEEGSGDIFSMMNSSYLNTARYVGSGSGNCGDGDWSCSRITEGMFPGYMGMMGNAGDYAYIDESDGYPRFIANTFNMISESEILFNLEYFKCEDSSCSIYSKDTINSLEISSFISSMDEGDGGTGDMLFYMLLFGSSYIDVDSNNNPAIVFNHLDGSLETEPSFNLSSARYVGSGNGLGCDSSDWNCTNILSTGLTEEEDLLSILMLKDFNIDENDNLGILGIGNPFGSGGNIVSLNYLSCLNNSCSSYSISEIVQDEISSPEILFFLGLSSLSISDSGSTFVTHSNYDDATIKIFKKDELRGISLDENNALYSAGDLGVSGNLFVDGSIATSNGIYLNSSEPTNTNNSLYNNGSELYWGGNVLATEDYVSSALSGIDITVGPDLVLGTDYTTSGSLSIASQYGGSTTLRTYNDANYSNYGSPLITLPSSSGILATQDYVNDSISNSGIGLLSFKGNYNTFVGMGSGTSIVVDSSAQYNTGIGSWSLYSNTTGYNNTANGMNSLYSNTTGYHNTTNGSWSLFYNTTGSDNTANGSSSLSSNTTASNNTANGSWSLFYNTTGSNNTALGYMSGSYYGHTAYLLNKTSSNSLYLGADTQALADGDVNEIVIGYSTVGNGSNTTTIGTGNVLYIGGSSISGKVARFTNSAGYCDINPTTTSLVCSSDITLKKNITTLEDIEYILNEQIDIPSSNLEKLLTLTPVKYNWNSEADDTSKHTGFIAQEVEQLFPELVSTDENTELKSISYSGFTPYVVEAIKELNLKVEAISLDDNDSNIFSSIIKKVENGIAYLTGLVVDTIVVGSQEKRTGITLYDEETGKPYCITVVSGEIKNREGECGVVEMPDICPNIDEYQQEIPDGYELNENNECIEVYIEEKSIDLELEKKVDVCSNIEGIQSNIPEGYNLGGDDECIKQDLKIPVDPSSLFIATPSQE